MKVIHYLQPENGSKVACGLSVRSVRYHTYCWQNTTCKRCRLTRGFLKRRFRHPCGE
ncbi:unnamed protein product [marine sediment metagenome]|uniref:Uncharacterized protein n=1 Tax=marine sediment metagenome TaxID=412755 RepID=X0UTM0_9ZZZZ